MPVLANLARRLAARSGPRTPPTLLEQVIVHGLYWTAFVLLARWVLATRGFGQPAGAGTIEFLVVILAVTIGFLIWAVESRASLPEHWFLTHLLWLARTWGLAVGGAALGFLLLILGTLIAFVFRPVAVLLIYGPFVAGAVIGIWFAWRMVQGYLALVRGVPVGEWELVGGEKLDPGRTGP